MMFRIEFYKDENGNSEIIGLLDQLKEIEMARIKQKDFLKKRE